MKNTLHISLIIGFIIFSIHTIFAQNYFVVSGEDIKIVGNHLVLKNAKFQNNGTFHSDGGTVVISGDAADANSTIEGSSATAFYNLTINKSANNVLLGTGASVTNTLTLTSGHLDLQADDLTISSGGTISGGSTDSYIKTSSTGVLIQEVSGSNITFPLGYTNYSPLVINNSGTTDNFKVRVIDAVYEDGTSGSELTEDVVDCSWIIEEGTAGGSNATLTMQWNSGDEMTNFDRTQSFLSEYKNGAWNNLSTQSASGSDPYTLSESNLTEFGTFIIASSTTALPVELLYFYGEQVTEGVQLDWQTATEINNSHFDVEWSTDGLEFQKIGEVVGAGTTPDVQFYDFIHATPTIGENYYRLRQVDLDGKYEYTQTILITISETTPTDNTTIKIFPNPTTEYFTLQTENQIGEKAMIFNIKGQLVQEFLIENARIQQDVTNLAAGTYFVKVGKTVKKLIILN